MRKNDGPLQKEDYAEPRCPLSGERYGAAPKTRAIPQQRVVEKLNEYMGRRDWAGAERHLLYWLEEARLGGDERGELLVRNECVGFYRKRGDRDKAMEHGDEAIRLIGALEMEGTISAGTTYTNVGTACNAFGENERALELFQRAKAIYESGERTDPQLLGGLYNNMGLVCTALRRCDEALALYEKALGVMETVADGAPERAITCLNMANAVEARDGMEKGEPRIFELLDKAYELLDEPAAPRGGYYAFVCESCAPTFGYYGYFLAADELKQRAEAIYGQTEAAGGSGPRAGGSAGGER